MSLKSKRPIRPNVQGQSNYIKPACDHRMLQYAKPGKNGECELVIGLDFGTSSSKVVIQAPDLPGCPSYAIDFGRFSSNSIPYLLPTRLWVSPSSGICTLTSCDNGMMVNNIKLELFSKDKSMYSNFGPIRQKLPSEEVAICYLALLLRFSRWWFLNNRYDLLCHFSKLIWSVNVGVPSPCAGENEENQTFLRVGRAAWWLSMQAEDSITLDKAGSLLDKVDYTGDWYAGRECACDLEVIPEIAAGAVGYALSDLRREGLHVMVDIGASTVDTCSFLLHERRGNDRYSMLLSDVQQLGSIRLFANQIFAYKKMYEERTELLLSRHDPMATISEDVTPYLISQDHLTVAFEKAKKELRQQLLCMNRRVIRLTKLHRAPNASLWREGRLPILLIGGGCKLEFFRSAIEELHGWLMYQTRNDGIIVLSVPIPDSLKSSIKNIEDYQFFAVAWGLSHRSMDIGEIIPVDQIPDVEPPPSSNWRKRYVGKELV